MRFLRFEKWVGMIVILAVIGCSVQLPSGFDLQGDNHSHDHGDHDHGDHDHGDGDDDGEGGDDSGGGGNNGGGNNGGGNPDPNVVEFIIPNGTGSNPWNTPSTPAIVKRGQILRIKNMDTTKTHYLHTNGNPCPHGNKAFALGESFDCVVPANYDVTKSIVAYDHLVGTSARFYMQVNP